MKTPNMQKPLLASVLAATLGATVPAVHADDLGEPRSMVVRIGDLDLSTRAGALAARRRITAAAEIVCGDIDRWNLAEREARRPCVQQAINGALAQLRVMAKR